MKLSEIVKQVSRDIDDDYSTEDVRDWVNRCLDELSPIAKRQSKKTADIAPENAYQLPDDVLKVYLVMVGEETYQPLPMEDTYNQGFKVWDNVLSLQSGPNTGEIDLYYYRKLKHVENAEDIPELEPEFHDLLVLYCLGHAQFYDEDYDERPDSLSRYNSRKQDYILYIEKKYRKNRKNVVHETVSW